VITIVVVVVDVFHHISSVTNIVCHTNIVIDIIIIFYNVIVIRSICDELIDWFSFVIDWPLNIKRFELSFVEVAMECVCTSSA